MLLSSIITLNNERKLTKLHFDCDSISGIGSGDKKFTGKDGDASK